MTRSKDMRQLAKEKLRSAQNAHDILDALWEGAWAKREKSDDEQHPPRPPTADLVQFLSSNSSSLKQKPIEESPKFAVFGNPSDNPNFSHQAFSRLGECLRTTGIKFVIVQGKAEIPSPHRPNTIYIEYNNDEHTISSTTSINDPDEIGVPAQKTQIARFSTGQSLIIISYMDNLLSPRKLPRRTRKQTKEIEELAERLVREAKETNNPQEVEWANQLAKDLTEIPDSDSILNQNIQTILKTSETIHGFWVECLEIDNTLKHPLAPIIEAWQQNTTAKRITKEHDRIYPVAILDRASMGSIRDVIVETNSIDDHLGNIQIVQQVPESKLQLEFWESDTDSKLPAILPVEMFDFQGGITTKSGAVAMPIRTAFEVLMAMDTGTTAQQLSWELGVMVDNLNPDGKFNWTNQIGYVIQGLEVLRKFTFPYKPPDSGIVSYAPFHVLTLPHEQSDRTSRIIIEARLPQDIGKSGMMVEKKVIRITGKKSSAKFNAYLAACGLFDKYGTVRGKIIDPTLPIERRDNQGYLLDGNGKHILSSNGKRIKNLRSAEAASQLDRERNKDADRYPILSKTDLVRACYPHGCPGGKFATYLARAKQALNGLEADGYVTIERLDKGWRIMPSPRHVNLYRAMKTHFLGT